MKTHFYIPYILMILSVLLNLTVQAQNKSVEIMFHVQVNKKILSKLNFKQKYNSLQKAKQSLISLKHKLQLKGFIETSIDSTVFHENILHTYIYIGKQYNVAQLNNGNIPKEKLKIINFNSADFENKPLNFLKIENLQQKLLSSFVNNGFPFAEVFLDSFSLNNYQLNTSMYVHKNELFLFDSLIVYGSTKTTSNYLQKYLNIQKGAFYNQSKITSISKKIAQLQFVKESRKPQVVFINGKATVNVFLEKQKSNEFDLLLGLLPNDKLLNRKLTITGEGRLRLYNSFGVGEEIYANFSQLKPKTQNLDVAFNYPYFINLPFGVYGAFNIYKNDTAFLNLNTKLGVSYPFNGLDNIHLFYQNQISNVLNVDTTGIKDTKKLPNLLDKINNKIGVAVHFQNLDYIFNPRKGYDITISTAVGTRTIKKNSQLTEIQSDIYNQINLTELNYNIDLEFKYNIPVLKKHSFLIANKSAILISKNILQNEKKRIGGSQLLRGFDEEEIFTPYFSVFTAEYHFSLSKNAYFYTFGDFAIVENQLLANKTFDTPFGFGVGTTFETKGGIFSLSYALGKQLNNPIEIKNGKIHFGYINLF